MCVLEFSSWQQEDRAEVRDWMEVRSENSIIRAFFFFQHQAIPCYRAVQSDPIREAKAPWRIVSLHEMNSRASLASQAPASLHPGGRTFD